VKKSSINRFQSSLNTAKIHAEVWRIVKKTVEYSLGKSLGSMMLFLDDLPLQIGAYHPVGTNNIVLNRRLIEIVKASISSNRLLNSLIYNLLLHEYLHALGEMSDIRVRRQVVKVSRDCLGDEHLATVLARKTPWVLLQKISLQAANAPKRVMEIVKDFDKTGDYII